MDHAMVYRGARGPGSRVPPGVVARGGEWSGESARCIGGVAGSASSSRGASGILRKWDCDGAGMCDGISGRERGDVTIRPAAWERDSGV